MDLEAARLQVLVHVIGDGAVRTAWDGSFAAWAKSGGWRGDFTGRLLPGFSADLVVLDRDILGCSPYDIGKTQELLMLFKRGAVLTAGGRWRLI